MSLIKVLNDLKQSMHVYLYFKHEQFKQAQTVKWFDVSSQVKESTGIRKTALINLILTFHQAGQQKKKTLQNGKKGKKGTALSCIFTHVKFGNIIMIYI